MEIYIYCEIRVQLANDLFNQFEYTVHPQHLQGLYSIATWLNIMHNNLQIALLVLTYLSIYNEESLLWISIVTFIALLVLTYLSIYSEESLVNKHCNLHKPLIRPSWNKKQNPIILPHYKLALIWMLFSLEYRKCFYSCLGPHITFFWDSIMKDFIKLYYLFKYFYI